MDAPDRRERLVNACWLLFWGVLASVWCVTSAQRLSATFDEPVYVRLGLRHWRTGSAGELLKLGTMPLPMDVQTLPIYLCERWRGQAFDDSAHATQLLAWARAGNLVFLWLLLYYALRAGRSLGGPWSGRLAVALIACEPSFLAHAGLATTDVSVAACLLALVYQFRTGREGGWGRRVGVPALWFAAAVLAKASGLVFGCICLVSVEVERRLAQARALNVKGWRALLAAAWRNVPGGASLRRDMAQVVGLGLGLAFIYCGSDWQPINDLVAWAHSLPQDRVGRAASALADRLRLFPNAGYAIVRQVVHNMKGHGVYLLGQTHQRALWYYFPVLMGIKLSVPLLVLPPVLVLCARRALTNWACAAAGTLLLFSVTCRVQTGIRFMLPLVAFAVVGLAAAASAAVRGRTQAARAGFGMLLAGAVSWSAAAACCAWPHGLLYINELWGGSRGGYRLVNDYDWGQGLKDLACWQREHGGDMLVWQFGIDPAMAELGLRPVVLHAPSGRDLWSTVGQLAGKRLAVSVGCLYYPPYTAAMDADQAYLRSLTPVGQTPTFLIYDIPSGFATAAGTSTALVNASVVTR